MELHYRRLYAAACISLITMACTFALRADTMAAISATFGFTEREVGLIAGPAFWGFAITILLCGFLIDHLGMGRMLWLAFAGHVVGVGLTIFAWDFWSMWFATLIIGLANGIVEGVINPLTSALYKRDKSKFLNILHAWWPGGLIIGGLLGMGLTRAMGLNAPDIGLDRIDLGWKVKTATILVPTLLYGALMFGQKFPVTERVERNIGYREMLRACVTPFFVVMIFIMMLTTSTELGPDQWISTLLDKLVGMPGTMILVYTAGIVFVMRFFLAGAMVRLFTPIGLLIGASFLSAVGLFGLSYSTTAMLVLVAATIFGVGKAYFWPTMLGVVAERLPRTGALGLCVVGAAGVFASGTLMMPVMGSLQDRYAVWSLAEISPATLEKVVSADGTGIDQGKELAIREPADVEALTKAKNRAASMTFRWVALVPFCLTFVFIAMHLHFRRRGGYRQDSLHE